MKIGTCSWKYDSWRGIVYPEFGDINYLEEYSKKYNTVEIDQWFWSLSQDKALLPKHNVVEDYNLATPDDFRFTVKAPNSLTLTHYYKSQKINPYFLSNDLMDAFLDNLRPIHNKLAVVMFQFEYLNKQKMESLTQFLNAIDNFLNNYKGFVKIGVEIRNPNYLTESYFEFLRRNSVTPVLLQGYYMPSIIEVYKKFKEHIKDQVVIRLHGYDRKGIEEKTKKVWNQIVESKDEELGNVINLIKDLQANEVDTYMNVNNHYEGSAPLTIDKISKRLHA